MGIMITIDSLMFYLMLRMHKKISDFEKTKTDK